MCELIPGMRVRVHFNLHRHDFSVVNPKTRRVICNVPTITLRDVEFRVSEAGRQRTLGSRRRQVHAYAIGLVETLDPQDVSHLTAITYNPYRAAHFHVQGHPEEAVRHAPRVTFADAYCYSR